MNTCLIIGVEVCRDEEPSIRRRGCPVVYFHEEGTGALRSLLGRGREPHQLVRPLVADALVDQGFEEVDPERIEWDRFAGCSCPCSSGFVCPGARHPEHGRKVDVFLTVRFPTPADAATPAGEKSE